MNRARNHRRDVALFRYLRATAHADQARPGPPWITWRRSACGPAIACPPFLPVQLGVPSLTPEQANAVMADVAKLTAALGRSLALPEGYELHYWAMEDGAPAHAITAEDGTVIYAATTAAPIQLGDGPA